MGNSPVRKAAKIILLHYLCNWIADKNEEKAEQLRSEGLPGNVVRMETRMNAARPTPANLFFRAMGGSSASIEKEEAKIAAKKLRKLPREEREAAVGKRRRKRGSVGKLLTWLAVYELTKKPAAKKKGLLHH